MKKVFLFACLSVPMFGFSQSTLVVGSGASIVGSGQTLRLTNTGITNNGTINAGPTVLAFNGGINAAFSGSGTASVQKIELDKPSAALTSSAAITASDRIDLVNGNMILSGGTVTLSPGAVLVGETETRRVSTSGTGKIVSLATGVAAPAALNSGNLGAAITSSSNLGNLSITRANVPAVNPAVALSGIQRTYLISPTSNTNLNATLRFYYLDAELNGKTESELELWRSVDGTYWNRTGFTSRNPTQNYVEKSGIGAFSYWTLSDKLNPLSATLESFGAACLGTSVRVTFTTLNQFSAEKFGVEKSADSISWIGIGVLPASGPAAGNTYTFVDDSPTPVAYYRIRITEPNSTFAYSPGVKTVCNSRNSPFSIFPNPSTTVATLGYNAAAPADAEVVIIDFTGRLMYKSKWTLAAGANQLAIPVAQYASGTYIVRIFSPAFETVQLQLFK